jgi:[ribosomal protein S5]-alanine N-acetyltransferase
MQFHCRRIPPRVATLYSPPTPLTAAAPMSIDKLTLESPRLRLRALRHSDASFILQLLNDPAFIQYIGDRKVRTLEQASQYIVNGPATSYRDHGFGLLLVELKSNGTPIGMCGLLQRNYLPDPDIGFAYLPDYRSQGFAKEAATAVIDDATKEKMDRLLAIVQPDNASSLRLLASLGFDAGRQFKVAAGDETLLLLARTV